MSTSALIKDLVPLGPARASAPSRKPEPRTDNEGFGRMLEDSRPGTRHEARPRDRSAPAEDPQGRETRRNAETSHGKTDRTETERPDRKARPEHADRSASDRGEHPPGLERRGLEKPAIANKSDTPPNTEPSSPEKGPDKTDETPAVVIDASQTAIPQPAIEAPQINATTQVVPAAILAEAGTGTADAVSLEAVAAAAPAATQDQVGEALAATEMPAPGTAAPPAAAIAAQAIPSIPVPTSDQPVAEEGAPLQVSPFGTASQAALSAPAASTADATDKKAGTESPALPDSASKGAADPKDARPSNAQPAKELASALEKLAEPGTPSQSQNAAPAAPKAGLTDAAALAKPTDPAHAMARADAPVPLQAIAVEIGMRAMRGSREFSIRLDPEDLGRVDIKLEISEAGDIQAKLVVERVETLQLLQRDAKTLERAFDQAGLKTNPDGLQFSLRDPGQQNRNNTPQDQASSRPAPASTEKDSSAIDEITLRPALYRASASRGLDIRI